MKLLVAEDQSATRIRLRSYLEKAGHEVALAEDGLQAWRLFQEGDFSIVVTDWEMPGMDGVELTKRIRADSREQYTYIIVLTAGNQILISESTYAEARSRAIVKGQQEAAVKGVQDPITAYEVVGFEGDLGLLPA